MLADCSMTEFIADHAASYVRVRSPRAAEVADLLRGRGLDVDRARTTSCGCRASTPPAIGELVGGHGLHLHELTLVRSSLEDAFMTLTADSVEYSARHARRGTPDDHDPDVDDRRPRPGPERARRPRPRLRRHAARGVDQVLDRAVDLLVGRDAVRPRRRAHRAASAGPPPTASPAGRPGSPPGSFVTWGMMFAQITALVLGALIVTSEYGTG